MPRTPPPATVAVIGCSNTQQAVAGYHRVSSAQTLWSERDLQGYGGKCIIDWANPDNPAWRGFEANLGRYRLTNKVWWEFCTHANEGTNESHADAALAILRTKTTLPVYVSVMDLTPSCTRADHAASIALVNHLLTQGVVFAGPVLSPLEEHQTEDGCHPAPEGEEIWGRELSEFFD